MTPGPQRHYLNSPSPQRHCLHPLTAVLSEAETKSGRRLPGVLWHCQTCQTHEFEDADLVRLAEGLAPDVALAPLLREIVGVRNSRRGRSRTVWHGSIALPYEGPTTCGCGRAREAFRRIVLGPGNHSALWQLLSPRIRDVAKGAAGGIIVTTNCVLCGESAELVSPTGEIADVMAALRGRSPQEHAQAV